MARHGSFTLNELGILLDELGEDIAKAFIEKGSFRMARAGGETAKHGYLNLGQDEALRNRVLAGIPPEKQSETIMAILRGEISIILAETKHDLFTGADTLVPGRFIPFPKLRGVCDPHPAYHRIKQPQINYQKVIERIRRYLSIGLQINQEDLVLPSADDFEHRTMEIIEKLKNNPNTANAINGVWMPIVLPQITIHKNRNGGYGTILEKFIDGIKKAYEETWLLERRSFTNYLQGRLAGRVGIASGSRHQHLIDILAKKPVVGVVLLPFSGYSNYTCQKVFRESRSPFQIPDWMLLGGGLDMVAAYIAYTEEISRNDHAPVIFCPALQLEDEYEVKLTHSLRFYSDQTHAYLDKISAGDYNSGFTSPILCI